MDIPTNDPFNKFKQGPYGANNSVAQTYAPAQRAEITMQQTSTPAYNSQKRRQYNKTNSLVTTTGWIGGTLYAIATGNKFVASTHEKIAKIANAQLKRFNIKLLKEEVKEIFQDENGQIIGLNEYKKHKPELDKMKILSHGKLSPADTKKYNGLRIEADKTRIELQQVNKNANDITKGIKSGEVSDALLYAKYDIEKTVSSWRNALSKKTSTLSKLCDNGIAEKKALKKIIRMVTLKDVISFGRVVGFAMAGLLIADSALLLVKTMRKPKEKA